MYKPKLSPEQIIEKLKTEKGVTFKNMSEEEAIEYLRCNNNYYRLASYRKNYDKKLLGEDIGKYIGLDFSYLVDLSAIDMHLRFLIIRMCLDVEHSLKVQLVNDVTSCEREDGYTIVEKFLALNPYLYEDIYMKRKSTYVGDLINNFFTFEVHESSSGKIVFDNIENRCPIWAFVEILSFGSFIKLFSFYYSTSTEHEVPIQLSLLNPIKGLRNACAHNNCIINNLRRGYTKPGKVVSVFVSKIPNISKDERIKYLSVRPIFEFICLLMAYDSVVFGEVKVNRYSELKKLVRGRMTKNKTYYKEQQLLTFTYKFIKKVVDFLC